VLSVDGETWGISNRIKWPALKVRVKSIMERRMKRIPFLAAALFAAAFALPVHAQDAMKKGAEVKPADPELKVVLDSWNDIGRKLITMAEDFPDDKYDYKPTPAQRSFADQLLHVAGANYFFINPVMGQKPPAGEDPKRDRYKTKSDIVAFVKKSFADGTAAIQSKGEKGLAVEVENYFPDQKVRVIDIANGIIEHNAEHYGQLVVYYRLVGMVPPESRPKK
jgi:uncharacterized damage-inducible protein DinB